MTHKTSLAVFICLAANSLAPSVASADEIKQSQQIVPILNNGSRQTLSHFEIEIDEAMTLKSVEVSVDGTTDQSDVQTVYVCRTKKRKATDVLGEAKLVANTAMVSIKTGWKLSAGKHVFAIQYALKPGATLTNRVCSSVVSVSFGNGTKLTPAASESKPKPQRLAYSLHKQGEFDCHTFRIPAIARTNDGTLLAVYDMRYNSRKDLQEHIDIGLSRSTDGGQTWSKPTPIMDMGEFGGKPQKENGCSDPGILVDANTGEIFVAACWTYGMPGTHQWAGTGSGPGFEIGKTTQFMMVRSKDDGVTWTKPENLTKQLKQEKWWLFAPAPTVGVTLKDGTLIMASQGRNETGEPFSNIMHSTDHGKTWTVSSPARTNCSECNVAVLSDGRLMLNIRDNRNRKQKGDNNGRAVSITSDLGKTWSVHSSDHKSLPAPVCNASLLGHKLADGRSVLLFSNPRNKQRRATMTLQCSFDDGKTWRGKHHVLLDEIKGAYSALVMTDDDTVGILYEASAADFVFQLIPLKDFVGTR